MLYPDMGVCVPLPHLFDNADHAAVPLLRKTWDKQCRTTFVYDYVYYNVTLKMPLYSMQHI